MRIVCFISISTLWVCIAVNICNLIRITKQQKEYRIAIEAAYEAWKNFLIAEQNYIATIDELRAEKEYFHTLRVSEEDTDK